ncbi:P-loop containing nucleoside triphosphate hydrolase protein, partial [Trametes sanguinea]
MSSSSSRLSAHEEQRTRSYEVLQHARDAAQKAYKYNSVAMRDSMVKEFRERMGGKDPYQWQLDVAEAILLRLDCTVIAGTGSGKTMPFIMPAFVEEQQVYIIVSPLNALETDQAERFRKLQVSAAVLNGTTFTTDLLKVEVPLALYRVGAFIVDEAHCIKQWAKDTEFRREYGRLGKLRALAPQGAPVLATSATLTPRALNEVREELCIHATKSFHLNLGNDRMNIKQEMRFMKSGSDYSALDFIVKGVKEAKDIPRTLVFVDEIHKCHAVTHRLRGIAGEHLRDYVKFYHAQRVQSAKDDVLELFRNGQVRVLIATEAAGMGVDIPDIELVVQFGVPENLSIWLQRAGRAGRSPVVRARAIMLVQESVVQEVKSKKGEVAAEESDSDFYEEEEHVEDQVETKREKRVFKKNVEGALREWIETKGCRRAVADAYFDNPPRAHGSSCPPSLCCDLCAARATSSLGAGAHSSTPSELVQDAAPGPSESAQPQDIKAEDQAANVLDRRKDEHLKHVKAELRAWRLRTRRAKYAGTSLKAENILPDRALQTIASVREGIKTVDDLREALKVPWPLLDVHGAEVLDLVKRL